MTIYELSQTSLRRAAPTTFRDIGITERGDLQRLLRTQVEAIAPDTFVLCEEFGQWEDSLRRIDLLALHRSANLVVIEHKRTGDGGHMELQALRYAAMVSTMTFGQAVEAHRKFRDATHLGGDPTEAILSFLGWVEPLEARFAQETRIVLASEDFSKEITTTVIWLNQGALDIRCVRMKPYKLDNRILLDVQQIIPLPEAAEYQVRLREKEQDKRVTQSGEKWDETRFMTALDERNGPEVRATVENLLRWAEIRFPRIAWGSGSLNGSWAAIASQGGKECTLFVVYTTGMIEIPFQGLAGKQPFADVTLREELRKRLTAAHGIVIVPDGIARYPKVPLADVSDAASARILREAFEWALDQLQSYLPSEPQLGGPAVAALGAD